MQRERHGEGEDDGPSPGADVYRKPVDDDHRREREADALRVLRHPGIVGYVGTGRCWLDLEFVPGSSLAEDPPNGLGEAISVLAAAVDTIGDLHAMGWTHGAIDESHVLRSADGRILWCGFSHAIEGADRTDIGRDQRDLIALVERVVARSATLTRADRRMRHRIARAVEGLPDSPAGAAVLARALAALGTRHGVAPPIDRVDHLDWDESTPKTMPLRAVGEGSELARPGAEMVDAGAPVTRRVLMGVGGGVVAVLAWIAVGTPGTAPRRVEPTAAPDAIRDAPPPSRPPSTATTSPPTAPSTIESPPRSVGDDRQETSVLVDSVGHLVASDDPEDRAAIGDWDCDGIATPALVRPGSGAVFVFDRWPGVSEPVSAGPVTHVETARSLEVVSSGASCDTLVVLRADGTRVVVDAGRP